MLTYQKKAVVAIFLSDKVNTKARNIMRSKHHFMMKKE